MGEQIKKPEQQSGQTPGRGTQPNQQSGQNQNRNAGSGSGTSKENRDKDKM
jgi:hypothetical protein